MCFVSAVFGACRSKSMWGNIQGNANYDDIVTVVMIFPQNISDSLSLSHTLSMSSQTYTYKCMKEELSYDSHPPTVGDCRPLAPRYGEYKYLPPQRWIHALKVSTTCIVLPSKLQSQGSGLPTLVSANHHHSLFWSPLSLLLPPTSRVKAVNVTFLPII